MRFKEWVRDVIIFALVVVALIQRSRIRALEIDLRAFMRGDVALCHCLLPR